MLDSFNGFLNLKMKKVDPRLLQSLELQNKDSHSIAKEVSILSLDWGEKFCGLAWTPDEQVCLPLGVFPRAQIENEINNIVQKKNITKIVVGIPISGDGTENHICQLIREFVKDSISIPVEWCNERGSSQATLSPNKDRIDDLAAQRILEQYLREREIAGR